MKFMDEKLATIWLREAVLAFEFFKQGSKLSFFGKLQKNSSNICREILNMAWDFFHIRQLEENAAIFLKQSGTHCYIPSLLTFDKKFIKIIELCPLKAHITIGHSKQPIPIYDDNALNKLFNNTNNIDQQFFSDEAKISRNRRRKNFNINIDSLIEQLESDVRMYCNNDNNNE